MNEKMTPEMADTIAAVSAASHQRGWDQGYMQGTAAAAAGAELASDAYARGFTDGCNFHLLQHEPVNLGGPYDA